MNRDQKAAVVEEVASPDCAVGGHLHHQLHEISGAPGRRARERLNEAGASSPGVVEEHQLTIIAADKAGTEDLDRCSRAPPAFTFVSGEGDPVLAAKALATFGRETNLLEIKGGRISGEVISIDEIQALARLSALEVLHGQLVGTLASPITRPSFAASTELIAGIAQTVAADAPTRAQSSGEAPAAEVAPAARGGTRGRGKRPPRGSARRRGGGGSGRQRETSSSDSSDATEAPPERGSRRPAAPPSGN